MSEDLVQATLPNQAAMGPAVTQAWQPIETAPKDGTLVDLVYPYPRGRVANMYWANDPFNTWVARKPAYHHERFGELLPEKDWSFVAFPNATPTHWMPAPKLPNASLTADPVPETVGA